MGIEYISKDKAKLIVNFGTGSNRKRKTKVITYKGKKDAQHQFALFEAQARNEAITDATVSDILSSYIYTKEMSGIEATTIKGYKTCEKRINLRFGRVLARDLTSYQVSTFILEMSEQYAPKTIKNTIALLSSSYIRAIQMGLELNNPCLNVTLPKMEQKDIKTLDEDNIQKLLQALDNELIDYRVGYKLCLFCGLRRSEVLGLTEDDVNLKERYVSIHSTRHRIGEENITQGTKTRKSKRNISIPQFLADEIEVLIAEHSQFGNKFLIQDGFGDNLNPSTFTNHLTRIEQNNSIEQVSVHGLRHTFATLLNASGIDIARISAELGHSNITTTSNIYTHIFGSVTESSRGIASSINEKYGKVPLEVPLEK